MTGGEGETNKRVRAETGAAKRCVDRRTASTIRQVEQKNISTAEWEDYFVSKAAASF